MTKSAETQFVEYFEYIMKAPIIVFPGQEDAFIDQKNKVTQFRLLSSKEISEGFATDYEAMIYISSMTLNAPIAHSLFEIYKYLFNKIFGESATQAGFVPIELDNLQKQELANLKRWIFRKQREAIRFKKTPVTITGKFNSDSGKV